MNDLKILLIVLCFSYLLFIFSLFLYNPHHGLAVRRVPPRTLYSYFPFYRRGTVSADILASVDVIIPAFIRIDVGEPTLLVADAVVAANKVIDEIEKLSPGKQYIFSVGGGSPGTQQKNFVQITTGGQADKLAQEIRVTIDETNHRLGRHAVIGVDIDWEQPGQKGWFDKEGFRTLVAALHRVLHPDYKIHFAVYPDNYLYYSLDDSKIVEQIDNIFVMAYDNMSKDNASMTWVVPSVRKMVQAGVPTEKLIILQPLYFRKIDGNHTAITYHSVAEIMNEQLRTMNTDDTLPSLMHPWRYQGETYDVITPTMMTLRVQELDREFPGMDGSGIWEIGQDAKTPSLSLARAIKYS